MSKIISLDGEEMPATIQWTAIALNGAKMARKAARAQQDMKRVTYYTSMVKRLEIHLAKLQGTS